MNEKDFLISVLQLIEVSLQRGAIRGPELDAVAVMRQYVAKNLEKYNESVPTQDSIEPEVVEEPNNKKDKK